MIFQVENNFISSHVKKEIKTLNLYKYVVFYTFEDHPEETEAALPTGTFSPYGKE